MGLVLYLVASKVLGHLLTKFYLASRYPLPYRRGIVVVCVVLYWLSWVIGLGAYFGVILLGMAPGFSFFYGLLILVVYDYFPWW